MRIKIIVVGKKSYPQLKMAIQDYTSRLERTMAVSWDFIVPSGKTEPVARKDESTNLLLRLKSSDIVWLLDETGQQLSSTALAGKIEVLKNHSVNTLIFIIGGAYGVDSRVRERANFVWSLSSLVFPHQIVRLLLIEQLYRASEINHGSAYHHA